MKAVSIKQPWASLIAAGVKTLEIRAWPTEHRGALLICSSRRPVLEGHQHGVALCVVDVVDCRAMTRRDVPFACVGEFYPNHFAWVLGKVRLIKPFSVMGQLRLFEIRDSLIHPLQTSGTNSGEAPGRSTRVIGKP
jgi:ASCH domain